MKIPLNRLVAFVGPYISILAGGIAAWLIAKANLIGFPGLGSHEHELATGLTAAGMWVLTTGAAHLGQMKWLKGVHLELVNDGLAQQAALSGNNPLRDPDVEAAAARAAAEEEELLGEDARGGAVPDDEELTSPPPGPGNTPVQTSQAAPGAIPEGGEFPTR